MWRKTDERHTSAKFVALLTAIVINQPRGKEIHVIADNLAAHKRLTVKDFLALHPKVHLHCTSSYSSWLNQVELWFGKIERDVIARGVFTGGPYDLARRLGVPRSLADMGPTSTDLDRAADLAVANRCWSPRPADRRAILSLLEDALSGSRPPAALDLQGDEHARLRRI